MLVIKIFCVIFTACTVVRLITKIIRRKMSTPDSSSGIFITGCDSGLGYSLAKYCSELGLTVFAGCLNIHKEGATKLKNLHNVYIVELDVRNINSIKRCLELVKHHQENSDVKVKYLVNNAGVMIFGEFDWLTEEMMFHQICVNLLGAMHVTKKFLSILRINQGRIINMSSHCALEPLPGLSIYGASKAGLLAWSDALRVELKQYGIEVISFIPGSYVQETSILSNQTEYTKIMMERMPVEDFTFYKEHMKEYNTYLSYIPKPNQVTEIKNKKFYQNFKHAILSIHPYYHYSYSPLRYEFYHFLLKITPLTIHDWLIVKFTGMPRWKSQ